MAIVLSGFLSYHCWLVGKGMTTNESAKWNEVIKKGRQCRTYGMCVCVCVDDCFAAAGCERGGGTGSCSRRLLYVL